MIPSRRDVLRFGAFGAGTLLLPRASFPAPLSRRCRSAFLPAGGSERRRRFLLHVRCPPAVDDQGRQDPELPRQGARSLDRQERRQDALPPRSSSRSRRFRDRFSVLNGVCMAPSFDGHLQNMNFLFAGKPFGGDSFRAAPQLRRDRPQAGVARRHRAHRSAVHQRRQPFGRGAAATGIGQGAVGHAAQCRAAGVRTTSSSTSCVAGWRPIPATAAASRPASSLMLAGLDGAPQVHRQLASLTAPARGR